MLKEKMDLQNSLLNKAIAESRAMNEEEQKSFDSLEIEVKNLEKTIEIQNKLEKREEEEKKVVSNVIHAVPSNNNQPKPFKNLVEQLKAVKDQATTGRVDDRLVQINNAASGMSEGNGADGGFAVQTDFAGMMMETAVKSGNILPLVDKYDITGKSNGAKWVDIDETSVASTVYGGVQVYWASEAATVTATKPKLIEKKMELEKLMGVAYATYELDSDSSFISDLYNRAFTTAIQRELENTVINGVGAGKPLGFLKGASLVTVAKEAGQSGSCERATRHSIRSGR